MEVDVSSPGLSYTPQHNKLSVIKDENWVGSLTVPTGQHSWPPPNSHTSKHSSPWGESLTPLLFVTPRS